MEWIPHNLSIDFIGKRKFFIIFSLLINIGILAGAAMFGLNWGVDFAGGSEIEVKFDSSVQASDVRKTMEQAGFLEASVQVVGSPSENSFLIHVGRIALLDQEGAARVETALRQKYGQDLSSFDFNPDFGDKLEVRFKKPVEPNELRKALESGGIHVRPGEEGLRPVAGGYTVISSGIADKIKAALNEANQKQVLPKAELRRIEFVGPQVGKQLRNKGILSVVYAMIAILIYVAFRFETRFAPGAVLSLVHDVIVVFGYFVVSRREFNLTSVAVLLTIVGYSINDTIVIYDRIRENVGKMRGMSLPGLVNVSVNETLSRTLLTSFATALSLVGLLVFGVGQTWDFAAAMMVGIITGTYSSIYIAASASIWLEEIMNKRSASASSGIKAA
jgi:preprotein translocase subunit SecF